MEGRKIMEGFIKVITSEKFYLPFVYVIVGLFLYLVVNSVINKLTAKHKSTRGRDKRKDTIIDLSKNIFKYIIVILIILQILKLYGVDTTSIIASIGVFAAVIGLAFQDVLKDLLVGATIILESQFAIGEIVEINGFKGEVISLTLKTTRLKSYKGEVKWQKRFLL